MTANLNIQMQNDRRSGHLLQGFVKWLAGQRPSFSSACRPSFHSLLRLRPSRLTWPSRQVGPTFERRGSCENNGGLNARAVIGINRGQNCLGLGLGVKSLRFGNIGMPGRGTRRGFNNASQKCAVFVLDAVFFHNRFSVLPRLNCLRWLKYIQTAWVIQQKSSIIFWREIANEIKPLNEYDADTNPSGRVAVTRNIDDNGDINWPKKK